MGAEDPSDARVTCAAVCSTTAEPVALVRLDEALSLLFCGGSILTRELLAAQLCSRLFYFQKRH